MPMAEFTATVMVTPLAVTLIASLALKERVSVLRWSLVGGRLVRHAGHPAAGRRGLFLRVMLLPLGLVISNAWFQVLTSKLAQTENPATMHFYTGCGR